VAWPFRVTDPLLEVLDVLVAADASLHGWAIMKQTHRSGATVYQVLERLRKARWVECWWEDEADTADRAGERENVPRRRYYRLSPEGMAKAPVLLAERAPHRIRLQRVEDAPGLVIFSGRRGLLFGGARS
jgi:PadR family transcriptional regulator PadR